MGAVDPRLVAPSHVQRVDAGQMRECGRCDGALITCSHVQLGNTTQMRECLICDGWLIAPEQSSLSIDTLPSVEPCIVIGLGS